MTPFAICIDEEQGRSTKDKQKTPSRAAPGPARAAKTPADSVIFIYFSSPEIKAVSRRRQIDVSTWHRVNVGYFGVSCGSVGVLCVLVLLIGGLWDSMLNEAMNKFGGCIINFSLMI